MTSLLKVPPEILAGVSSGESLISFLFVTFPLKVPPEMTPKERPLSLVTSPPKVPFVMVPRFTTEPVNWPPERVPLFHTLSRKVPPLMVPPFVTEPSNVPPMISVGLLFASPPPMDMASLSSLAVQPLTVTLSRMVRLRTLQMPPPSFLFVFSPLRIARQSRMAAAPERTVVPKLQRPPPRVSSLFAVCATQPVMVPADISNRPPSST